jgi:glycosyltransferase involved in cell wall biosynthesis
MNYNQTKSIVSVVIPTYNRGKIIEETLKSVLNQTYKNIEIIIVDDGSQDNTYEIIKNYFPKLKYFRQENLGVEAARKRGVKESSGDYINFLDDDDLMRKDKIEKQVRILDSRQDYGVVHCGYYFIDNEGNLLDVTGRLPEGDLRKQLVWGCFPWSGGPLIRRECFKVINENDHKDWFSDWGMWLKFAFAGYKFGCIQEPLGYYKMIKGSMTDNKISNAERLVFNILDSIYSKSDLPADIIAEKYMVYASWHFWISCRYYLGGFWIDAKRNFTETIRLNEELITVPENLLGMLYMDAVSARVRIYNPIKFIEDIFDHLPAEAEIMKRFRNDLLCRIYAYLIMKSYGINKTIDTINMDGLINITSQINNTSEIFYNELYNYRVDSSTQVPFSYVNKIFKQLYPNVNGIKDYSKIVEHLVEENIKCAFQNYLERNWKLLFDRILMGITNHPFTHFIRSIYLIKNKFDLIVKKIR